MTDESPMLEVVEPTVHVKAAPARKSNRMANLLLGLAGLVAVTGMAFAAGRLTAPAATTTPAGFNGFPTGSFNPGNLPGGGQGGPGGIGARLGGVSFDGEVTAISDTSITIRLDNGSTVEVPVDSSTKYSSAAPSSATEVVVGDDVLVQSSQVGFNPGASPDPAASIQPSVGTARQVIVLSE